MLAVVEGDQIATDKIVRWQEESHRWGRYMLEGIEGYHKCTSSSPAESNHASLAAIAPDDPTRTLEQNIVDVMERTSLLFQKRKVSKAKWASTATSAIKAMSGARASHLSEPRKVLDQRPYKEFLRQYDCYMQYNCLDEVRGNVQGCVVSHTSSPEDGYFIPDGQPCPCKYEKKLKVGGCRHSIAKRIHRKQHPFCKATVHPSNIFRESLPEALAGHGKVGHNFDMSDDLVSGDDFDIGGKDVSIGDGAVGSAESHTPAATAVPVGTSVSTSDQARRHTTNRVVSNTASDALVFASPGKAGLFTNIGGPQLQSTADANKNVNYHSLLNEAKDVVKAAQSRCNPTQHFILDLLTNLKDLLTCGNYTSDEYKGDSCLGPIAEKLSLLSGPGSITIRPNFPKMKTGTKQGAPGTLRFGAEGSTASKPKRNCTFCNGTGNSIRIHSNKSNCPVKEGFGKEFAVKPRSMADIGDVLNKIGDGKMVDFIDVSTILDVNNRRTINFLPTTTRRVIVKGYNQNNNEKYLLCSCIDNGADVVKRKEGTKTQSYDNLLVKCSAIVTNLSKLDYIFHKPVSTIEDLEQPTKSAVHMDDIEGQLKSPPEEMIACAEKETMVERLVEEMKAGDVDETILGVVDETTTSVVEKTTAGVAEETMVSVVKETMVAGVEKETITVGATTRRKRKTAQEGMEKISKAIASGGMAHVDDTKVKRARKK